MINIAIVGHVDHGKSTVLGRLLHDTQTLPVGKLKQIQEHCKTNAKKFEYAFLLDALKDEQSQGITIDFARCFFKFKNKQFLFLDAPGHVEFIKNMVTGAAQADVAVIVIDAQEGIQENSKRHGYLLSLLDIQNVIVLINKMDLVQFDQKRFENLKNEYQQFLSSIDIYPFAFIPVSGFYGDNLSRSSKNISWFKGLSFLELLMQMKERPSAKDKRFCLPVQDVYKFTDNDDHRRIIAGTVLSGKLHKEEQIRIFPSGQIAHIQSILSYKNTDEIAAQEAVGLTLKEPLFIKRGDLIVKAKEKPPIVARQIRCRVFWLGDEPLRKGKKYKIKHCTASTFFQISKIINVLDTKSFTSKRTEVIEKNDVAEIIIDLDAALAFDIDHLPSSRFVIAENFRLCGGGIILQDADEKLEAIQMLSNVEKYEKYFHQRACVCFLHDPKGDITTGLHQYLLEKKHPSICFSLHLVDFSFASSIYSMLIAGNIVLVSFQKIEQLDRNRIEEKMLPFEVVVLGFDDCQNNKMSYDEVLDPKNMENIYRYFLEKHLISK